MTTGQFVQYVSERSGIPKRQIAEVLDAITEALESLLRRGYNEQHDAIHIGFCRLLVKKYAPSKFLNLHTQRLDTKPMRRRVRIFPAKKLDDAINPV